MNSWKIINKIALIFGLVFIVFTALAGVISYELDKLQYTSSAPAAFIAYTIIVAMLPYLVLAVVSFVVYIFSIDAEKEEEKQPEMPEEKTEPEHDVEEVFKETPAT